MWINNPMKISEIIALAENSNDTAARLDELVGVKDRGLNDLKAAMNPFLNADPKDWKLGGARMMEIKRFVKMLQENGWQSLGAGCYGSVFTHPNLNYCIKLFTKDPIYLRFVKFCQANPAPCLPKFRGKLMRVDTSTFAVRMETLTPISGKFFKELTFAICEFTSDYDWTVEGYMAEYADDSLIRKYFTQNPDLLTTLEKLKELANPTDWDIGVNNVMLRGETMVITDPWAE